MKALHQHSCDHKFCKSMLLHSPRAIFDSVAGESSKIIISFSIAPIRLHLSSLYKKLIDKLAKVQQRSLRCLRLCNTWPVRKDSGNRPKMRSLRSGSQFFTDLLGGRTNDNDHKLKQGTSDLRQNIFIYRTFKHWKRLPRGYPERMCSLPPWRFRRLNKTLGNLVWFHSWPCFEKTVELETPGGLFQPHISTLSF